MSTLFLRTLRDNPADADVPSHRLLVRGGYVRRVAPGVYSWLPLGYRVFREVERVVREEMDAIGAQEVHFPSLVPRETFAASGRWDDYGDLLFRLADRKQADYLLAPTHEELFTLLVKGEYSSYRDYPVALYQIQTKFRDEARPRAGILRGREFVMKDAYTFDLDDEGLAASYARQRGAYRRIFDRLGFDYRIVSAVSGAMGGSASEEFLAPCEYGEDEFVSCADCDYAANTEAVELVAPTSAHSIGHPADHPPMQVLDTPDSPTIDTLVAAVTTALPGTEVHAADTLKNVVLVARGPGAEPELLVIGVPGDREVDLKRLNGQLEPVQVTQAEPADLARAPRLVKGYIGPQIMAEIGVRYLVDPLVGPGTAWITGANVEGRHAAHVVRGRDFTPDGEVGAVAIRDGDRCVRCGGVLSIGRGIEIGHVFQLGRKYADVFGLDALGPDGAPRRITMGSYGIGVSRAVAALAEQTHDDAGLCWPAEIAPAQVHVVAAGKGEEIAQAAESLVTAFDDAGVRVLFDDRTGVSVGVKFTDAELLGMPWIVVVGRGLATGVLEVRDRRTGERSDVPVDEVVGSIMAALAAH